MKRLRVVPEVSYYVETSMALMSGRRRRKDLCQNLFISFLFADGSGGFSYMVTAQKTYNIKCEKGQI